MNRSPIALFVYNRPEHTRKTVEALTANVLAMESDLFIFSDGPKNNEAEASVAAVREYVRNIGGFRSVTILERPENVGLARSIITGVSELVTQHGRIIVLEDDLVTSPYFLQYMNDALEVYKNEERVMHISGYMFQISTAGLPQTFFYRQTSCWGWATWQRAWRFFNPDAMQLGSSYNDQLRYRFNIEGAYDFWEHLRLNCTGEWDTWAIKWYASVFLMEGLCLHPAHSMVANIGFDSSGSNCNSTSLFDVTIAKTPVMEFETTIAENRIALARIRRFLNPSPIVRTFRMLTALLRVRTTA
jgi:hypothetical protein